MALSGSIHTNVNSRWRLSIEWSATQDIANNRSTVTSKMYWESLDGYGSVYSSATKDGAIQVNGGTYTFTGSAALSGRQKKLLYTKSVTITHDADGTKTFPLDGYFDAEVTLNGTYYGRIGLPYTYFQLNTIPRESTLIADADWTAGHGKYVNIKRASTNFTHTLKFYVNGYHIKTVTGVGYSQTVSFDDSENLEIFQRLGGRTSEDTKIVLETYDGSRHIGTTSKTGTVTAPNASYVSGVNGEVPDYNNERDVYTDQFIQIGISRANSDFTHTIKYYAGSTLIRTFTGVTTGVNWTPTSAEQNTIHNLMPTTRVIDGNIEVTTYYKGQIVRSATDNDINFYVRNANPYMPISYVTHKDANATTVGITQNDQILIQDHSNLMVTLSAAATAYKGASISRYEVSINGVTKSASGIGTFAFGTISAGSNISLSCKVTDSRGFTTTVSKTVRILAYSPPVISLTAERLGGFEPETTVDVEGSLTPLINNENYIKEATVHYRNRSTGVTAGTTSLTLTGYPDFAANSVVYNLDNQTAFDIVVNITDVLSSVTATIIVDAGRPILFIDSEKGSVGIGDFPIGENELLVNGRLVFGATQWATSGGGLGAIDLNNGDVVRANGIFFNDMSSNNGEGLLFLKSWGTSGTGDVGHYDQLYVRDGVLYLNHGGVKMDSLHIANGDDVAADITGRGLTIGTSETSGQRIKIDSNEVASFSGANPATLHLNPDGGVVHVGINSPSGGSAALETNGSVTINGNGPNTLNIKAVDHAYIQWHVKNSTTRSGYFGYGSGGSSDMALSNQIGAINMHSAGGGDLTITHNSSGGRLESDSVYGQTTSYASNVYVWSTGLIARSTSASKYKLDIQTVDAEDLSERLLYLQPKSWYDKASSEALADYLTREFNGEDHGNEQAPYLRRHYGLIAEDLLDLGLDMFVQYGEPDENGHREIEGIEYDRAWVLLIPLVKKQKDQIQSLEERMQKLETIHN